MHIWSCKRRSTEARLRTRAPPQCCTSVRDGRQSLYTYPRDRKLRAAGGRSSAQVQRRRARDRERERERERVPGRRRSKKQKKQRESARLCAAAQLVWAVSITASASLARPSELRRGVHFRHDCQHDSVRKSEPAISGIDAWSKA